MAGVGRHGNNNLAAGGRRSHAARAEVILHVAGALRARGIQVAFELRKNLRQRFADNVGQHVEPPAVGHTQDDLVHIRGGRAVDQLVQIAIAVSAPSSANRFCPTNRACRKCSNSSASVRCLRISTRSGFSSGW